MDSGHDLVVIGEVDVEGRRHGGSGGPRRECRQHYGTTRAERMDRTRKGGMSLADMAFSGNFHAAKILANLIVMGGGILARAVVQAYRQALTNASKNGVAQETIQNTMRRASKVMTEQEARQILGVTEETPWEEIIKKYDNLFENNAKNGSFYLQSKVHRAKECLEAVQQGKSQGTPS
ncbi:Mitochondrial import inner membrane translocase subunit PAM16 like 2 [Glycine soja]